MHLLSRIWQWLKSLFATQQITPPSTQKPGLPLNTSLVAQELGMSSAEPPQYHKYKSLFTYREQAFYRALRISVGSEYLIFGKVRLGDLIWLANEPENRKFHSNQIQCKHVDYVLCHKVSFEPMLVIELDDSSHAKPEQQERDKVKDATLASAGLPLLRVELQGRYETKDLRELIKNKLGEVSNTTSSTTEN